jgi:hypothetical protein
VGSGRIWHGAENRSSRTGHWHFSRGVAQGLLQLEVGAKKESVDWRRKTCRLGHKMTSGLVSVRGPLSCSRLFEECAQRRNTLEFACQSSHEREEIETGHFYGLTHMRMPSRGPNYD